MSSDHNAAEKQPDEIELLLPWHAAGTLSRRDAARVEHALANDPALAARYALAREELVETIGLNESLGAPSQRAISDLFARIDAEPAPAKVPYRGFNFPRWLANIFAAASPRALAYGAAAAAIVIFVQAAVLAGLIVKDGVSPGGFRTASAPSAATGSFVSVRFRPEATAASISQLLSDNHATIEGGPSAVGMFRLRVASRNLPDSDLDAIVRTLSSSPIVSLAARAD